MNLIEKIRVLLDPLNDFHSKEEFIEALMEVVNDYIDDQCHSCGNLMTECDCCNKCDDLTEECDCHDGN